jgi:hypothetical protein
VRTIVDRFLMNMKRIVLCSCPRMSMNFHLAESTATTTTTTTTTTATTATDFVYSTAKRIPSTISSSHGSICTIVIVCMPLNRVIDVPFRLVSILTEFSIYRQISLFVRFCCCCCCCCFHYSFVFMLKTTLTVIFVCYVNFSLATLVIEHEPAHHRSVYRQHINEHNHKNIRQQHIHNKHSRHFVSQQTFDFYDDRMI